MLGVAIGQEQGGFYKGRTRSDRPSVTHKQTNTNLYYIDEPSKIGMGLKSADA